MDQFEEFELPTPLRQTARALGESKRANLADPESAVKRPTQHHPSQQEEKNWRQQCERLHREVRDATDALKREQREKKALEEKLNEATMNKSRRGLEEAAEMRKRMRDEDAHEKKQLSEALSKLKDEKCRSEGLIADVRKAEIEAKNEREAATKAKQDREEIQNEFDELRVVHQDLLKTNDALQETYKKSQEELSVKVAEMCELATALRISQEEKANVENEMLKQVEKCNQTEATFKNLAAELTEYRTNSVDSQVTQLECTNAKHALQEMTEANASLRTKLNEAVLALSMMKDELEKAKVEYGGLQGAASQSEATREDLQHRLTLEMEESATLRGRFEAMSADYEDKISALEVSRRNEAVLQKTVATTKEELTAAMSRFSSKAKALGDLENKISEYENIKQKLTYDLQEQSQMTDFEANMSKQYAMDYEEAMQKVRVLEQEKAALTEESKNRDRSADEETQKASSLMTALFRCQQDHAAERESKTALEATLTEQRARFAELEMNYGAATRNIEHLKAGIMKSDGDTSSLRMMYDAKCAEHVAASKALESATIRIAQLEANGSSIQTSADSLREQVASLTSMLETERAEKKAILEDLHAQRKNAFESSVLVDAKTKENVQLYIAADAAEKKMAEMESNINANRAQIVNLQQTLQQGRQSTLAMEAAKQLEITTLTRELEETRQDLEHAKRNITLLKDEVRVLETEKVGLKENIRGLEHTIVDQKTSYKQLTLTLGESREATTRAQKEVHHKIQELSKQSETLQLANSRLLQTDEEVRNYVSEIAEARSQLTHVTLRLDDERHNTSQLTSEIAQLKAAHNKEQTASNSFIADYKGEIAHLQASLKRANVALEADATENARLRNQLEAAEASLAETESQLASTQTELKAEIEAHTSLQQQFEMKGTKMQETVNTVRMLKQELSNLGEQFITSQQRCQQSDTALVVETGRTAQYVSEISRMQHNIDSLNAERTSLHAKVTNLTAQYERVAASEVRAIESARSLEDSLQRADISQRHDRLELTSKMAELMRDLESAQNEVDRRRAEVKHLRATNEALESDLNDQRGKVFALGREVEDIFTTSSAKIQQAEEQRDLHIRKYHTACWDNVQLSQDSQEWRQKWTVEYESFEQQQKNYEGAMEKMRSEFKQREEKYVEKIRKYKQHLEVIEKK